MTQKKHKIKINQEYAEAYYKGVKNWEIRLNDRDFKVGDIIEFEIKTKKGKTVGFYEREILYLFEGEKYGLVPGYCIFSIEGEYPLCENYHFDCWDRTGLITTKDIFAQNEADAKLLFEAKFPDLAFDDPYI